MIDSAREAKPNRETTARQKQSETRRAARQTEEAQSEQAGQTNTETKQERRRSKEKEDRYKGNASCKRGGEQLLPSPDKCVSPQSPGVRFEWKVFHPRASLDVRWWQPVYFGRSGRGRGGALGLNASSDRLCTRAPCGLFLVKTGLSLLVECAKQTQGRNRKEKEQEEQNTSA